MSDEELSSQVLRELTVTKFAWQGAESAAATADDYLHRVERCRSLWGLRVEGAIEDGIGLPVLRVVDDRGESAVLKVGWEECFTAQADALEAANGRGYVRLLARDDQADAILMEALGGPLEETDRSPAEKLDLQVELLREVWQVDLPDPRPGFDKAASLRRFIADQGHRAAGHERVLAAADELAATLTGRGAHPVIVHGDPHTYNILARGADGWAFVDPDPFACDAAYDLGASLRHWRAVLLDLAAAGGPQAVRRQLDEWAAHLAGLTGVDARLIADWAFVERVTTSLALLQIDHLDEAEDLLALAAMLVPQDAG